MVSHLLALWVARSAGGAVICSTLQTSTLLKQPREAFREINFLCLKYPRVQEARTCWETLNSRSKQEKSHTWDQLFQTSNESSFKLQEQLTERDLGVRFPPNILPKKETDDQASGWRDGWGGTPVFLARGFRVDSSGLEPMEPMVQEMALLFADVHMFCWGPCGICTSGKIHHQNRGTCRGMWCNTAVNQDANCICNRGSRHWSPSIRRDDTGYLRVAHLLGMLEELRARSRCS